MKQASEIISVGVDGEGEAHGEVQVRSFTVPAASHGQRLDRVLAEQVPELSRSYLQQLIEAGHVRLASRVVTKAAQRVRAGEAVSVELLPTAQAQAFRPEPVAFPVLYEDDDILVIDKPAGLVVHPAAGNWTGTLLNGLLARDARCALLPRAGIVHRLDKDTSGLMVVARSRVAMDRLVERIAAREVERQYLAIAHRPWTGPERRIVEGFIGRDPRNRLRMAAVGEGSGKPAWTAIDCLWSGERHCVVHCTLGTGRTHQIRVHMATLGHPLVGDRLYGGTADLGLERQALHAYRLAFRHPISNLALEFRAALAPDLADAAQRLGYNPPL